MNTMKCFHNNIVKGDSPPVYRLLTVSEKYFRTGSNTKKDREAPQTFQHILSSIFVDLFYQWLIIYIDDPVIWSNTDHGALSGK